MVQNKQSINGSNPLNIKKKVNIQSKFFITDYKTKAIHTLHLRRHWKRWIEHGFNTRYIMNGSIRTT